MWSFAWRLCGWLLLFIALAAGAGAASGAIAGWAVLGASLGLGFAYHYRQAWRLRHWLERPEASTLPDARGLWREIYYPLHRFFRQQSLNQLKLTTALERFQHAAQAMPDGIVMLNADHRIEWCNPMAGAHLGLNAERDRGRYAHYLVRDARFAAYLTAPETGGALSLKSPVDREIALTVQLVPYGDDQKLLISRDVSELLRADTVRRDFVANVSHELRTPITVIAGFLETFVDMEAGAFDPEVLRYFGLMLEEARRMQRLVVDLLTLSRLENDHQPMTETAVDVRRLVRAVANDTETLSAGRHAVSVSVETEADLLGNEDELRSAFSNLASNAVRYTPAGGSIQLRWRLVGAEGWFSVTDTGEGIEAHHIPRLTERFYRVDRSRSRETGGTGLGLAIVKHVVARHRASLDVQSRPGHGSTFSIVFGPDRLLLR